MNTKKIQHQATRREMLKAGAVLASMLGLGQSAIAQLAEAAAQIRSGAAPLLWLQGLSCTGCSVSLLNSDSPGPAEVVTKYISLGFHSTLSAATGKVAINAIEAMIAGQKGQYIVAVEGAIPQGMPVACEMGGEPFGTLLTRAAQNAKAVVAVGTCAASGGIPAAADNPTGAVAVAPFLKQQKINVPIIALPGCPAHPDWIVGTLAHVLKFGIPPLDSSGRPTAFYGKLVHDQCPRFADYERERFATRFGEDGCLFKLGCMGVNTHADCTLRQWNGGTNTCTRAGAPCIGCASAGFTLKKELALYRKTELQSLAAIR